MASLLAGWWTAIWPNLAANVIWLAPTFVWSHRSLKRHIDKRHAEQRAHITATATPSSEEV